MFKSLLLRYLFPLLATLIFSTGCSSVRLSSADRASIRSVVVAGRSQFPARDRIMLHTFKQNMAGAFGGVVGAVISEAAAGDDRAALCQAFVNSKTDLGLIMSREFEQRLRAAHLFVASKRNADAEFQFDIAMAGLCIPNGFATRLIPVLWVDGQLVRNGKTIWKMRTKYIGDKSNGCDFEDYMQNPELLRSEFTRAATWVADDFVRDLRR